jgi:hypothetical protein
MSPEVLADLIYSFVLIFVGCGFITYGQKIKNSTPSKSHFASPNVFIVSGVLILVAQIVELVETYL